MVDWFLIFFLLFDAHIRIGHSDGFIHFPRYAASDLEEKDDGDDGEDNGPQEAVEKEGNAGVDDGGENTADKRCCGKQATQNNGPHSFQQLRLQAE